MSAMGGSAIVMLLDVALGGPGLALGRLELGFGWRWEAGGILHCHGWIFA